MRIPIENCTVRFSYECPKAWDELAETGDSLVRFCAVCEQNVYWSDTVALAKHLGA